MHSCRGLTNSESAIDGNIPADILTRIPEHCVYIDACGGFFAQLLYDPDLHCPLLGLYGAEQVVFVPLIHGPLDEALDKYRKLPHFQNNEDIIGKFTDEIAAGIDYVLKISIAYGLFFIFSYTSSL